MCSSAGNEARLWLRVHAQAIRERGAWIRGAIDPASRGRSQVDGPAASIPSFQRCPLQGRAGAIYPIPESDIVVPDFEIPEHWPHAFGMDVAWNRTAVVWMSRRPRKSRTLDHLRNR